jgi:hypothetical protein
MSDELQFVIGSADPLATINGGFNLKCNFYQSFLASDWYRFAVKQNQFQKSDRVFLKTCCTSKLNPLMTNEKWKMRNGKSY